MVLVLASVVEGGPRGAVWEGPVLPQLVGAEGICEYFPRTRLGPLQ